MIYEIVYCQAFMPTMQTIAKLEDDGLYRCVRCGEPMPVVVTGTTIEEAVRLRRQNESPGPLSRLRLPEEEHDAEGPEAEGLPDLRRRGSRGGRPLHRPDEHLPVVRR